MERSWGDAPLPPLRPAPRSLPGERREPPETTRPELLRFHSEGDGPWPRLPREAVESPSLEIFQPRLDKVLWSLVWVTLLGQGVGLGDPRGPFQPPPLCNSVTWVPARHSSMESLLSAEREMQIGVARTRRGAGDGSCEDELSPSLADGHLPSSQAIRAEVWSLTARRDEIRC